MRAANQDKDLISLASGSNSVRLSKLMKYSRETLPEKELTNPSVLSPWSRIGNDRFKRRNGNSRAGAKAK